MDAGTKRALRSLEQRDVSRALVRRLDGQMAAAKRERLERESRTAQLTVVASDDDYFERVDRAYSEWEGDRDA